MRSTIARMLGATAVASVTLFAASGVASADPAANPAISPTHGHTRPVAQSADFDAHLTSAQLTHLRASQARPVFAFRQDAAADDQVGILWQGGFDRDHWWFKISKAEVISIGVGAVCRAIAGAASWFVCPPLVAAVNWAVSQWPNAGGYWAELYTNGQVRVGTW